MVSSDPNEKLRNFQFPKDLYYELEYVAESENRNTKDQLIHILRTAVDQFKSDHGKKKLPLTDKRKKKLAAGKD